MTNTTTIFYWRDADKFVSHVKEIPVSTVYDKRSNGFLGFFFHPTTVGTFIDIMNGERHRINTNMLEPIEATTEEVS